MLSQASPQPSQDSRCKVNREKNIIKCKIYHDKKIKKTATKKVRRAKYHKDRYEKMKIARLAKMSEEAKSKEKEKMAINKKKTEVARRKRVDTYAKKAEKSERQKNKMLERWRVLKAEELEELNMSQESRSATTTEMIENVETTEDLQEIEIPDDAGVSTIAEEVEGVEMAEVVGEEKTAEFAKDVWMPDEFPDSTVLPQPKMVEEPIPDDPKASSPLGKKLNEKTFDADESPNNYSTPDITKIKKDSNLSDVPKEPTFMMALDALQIVKDACEKLSESPEETSSQESRMSRTRSVPIYKDASKAQAHETGNARKEGEPVALESKTLKKAPKRKSTENEERMSPTLPTRKSSRGKRDQEGLLEPELISNFTKTVHQDRGTIIPKGLTRTPFIFIQHQSNEHLSNQLKIDMEPTFLTVELSRKRASDANEENPQTCVMKARENPSIRVGDEYQAVIPDCCSDDTDRDSYCDDMEEILWKPPTKERIKMSMFQMPLFKDAVDAETVENRFYMICDNVYWRAV